MNGSGLYQIFFGLIYAGFAVFWIIGAGMAGGGLMALFGIPFVIVGVAVIISGLKKMTYKPKEPETPHYTQPVDHTFDNKDSRYDHDGDRYERSTLSTEENKKN